MLWARLISGRAKRPRPPGARVARSAVAARRTPLRLRHSLREAAVSLASAGRRFCMSTTGPHKKCINQCPRRAVSLVDTVAISVFGTQWNGYFFSQRVVLFSAKLVTVGNGCYNLVNVVHS